MVDINELEHSATNVHGKKLEGFIEKSKDDEDIYILYEKGTKKKLAYIDFSIVPEKKVIFINDMENLVKAKGNSYKGIGSLLHEFVFYHLAKLAKNNTMDYPIQLTKAHGSSPFHYKCGYRFTKDADNKAMENVISQGPEYFRNKKNTDHFPDSMRMAPEDVNEKKAKYTSPKKGMSPY